MCSRESSPPPRSRSASTRGNAGTQAGPRTRTGARRHWSKRLARAPAGTWRRVSSWACCSVVGPCARRRPRRSAVRARPRAPRRSQVVTPGRKTLRATRGAVATSTRPLGAAPGAGVEPAPQATDCAWRMQLVIPIPPVHLGRMIPRRVPCMVLGHTGSGSDRPWGGNIGDARRRAIRGSGPQGPPQPHRPPWDRTA
jgi:hypothetical protein